jgi:GGDEF domain-containing protein
MTAELPFRRALLAASPTELVELRRPFADPALAGWRAADADAWERAHFLLRHDSFDVLLADESLRLGPDGPSWLAGPRQTPVVLLSRPVPETVQAALAAGVDVWLPRDLALRQPALLAAALDRARRWGQLRQRLRSTGSGLEECRGHVGRLVDLLWQTGPRDPRAGWYSHRHMLERLQEEVARTARYGTPLSVVLGEVRPNPATAAEPAPLAAWTVDRVSQVKRRCDVAGQYGPHGFMLLLTNTPEAGAETFRRRLEETLSRAAASDAVPVVASYGVAGCSGAPASSPGLLRRAEEDLEADRDRAGAEAAPASEHGP